MEKLTGADANELMWWFAEPPPASIEGRLAAQTYDPRGGGHYEPTTDLTLEKVVFGAMHAKPCEWTRIRRILNRVFEGTHGRHHVEVLRAAFDAHRRIPSLLGAFEYPAVAIMTETAQRRGRDLAEDDEHHRTLEVVYGAARRDHCSPISVGMRVLEADARGTQLSDDLIRAGVLKALARAVRDTDEATLSVIRDEVEGLVAAAGSAYRVARKELRATRRQAQETSQKAKDAEWDAYITAKRAKEAARFEAKLKRVS